MSILEHCIPFVLTLLHSIHILSYPFGAFSFLFSTFSIDHSFLEKNSLHFVSIHLHNFYLFKMSYIRGSHIFSIAFGCENKIVLRYKILVFYNISKVWYPIGTLKSLLI